MTLLAFRKAESSYTTRFSLYCVSALLIMNGCNEYRAPTAEETENAATAIETIPTLEQKAATDYFNPGLHAQLAVAYSSAFAGHTDNGTYLERAISEYVVSLRLKKDPEVLSSLQQLYTAYHANRTPKNMYTPSVLSFQSWHDFISLLSPRPEDVRLLLNAQSDLDAVYRRYEHLGPQEEAVAMSYQAARGRVHEMFLIATGRRVLRSPSGGRIFLTPAGYEEWSKAIHSFGFASANNLSVDEIYDRTFPPDAVLITGGDDRGCYRIAPNLVITPGLKYFEEMLRTRGQ